MSPADSGNPPRVETLTFGCRLNIVESEAMRAAAEAAGEQDVVIVNTCGVTADAARQAAQAIRRLARERPHKRIVATGCGVEIEPARFHAMPEISRVLPNAKKLLSGTWGAGGPSRGLSSNPTLAGAHTRAFLDIQNGCDHRCTFCVIPIGRGPSRSRSIDDIMARVSREVSEGRKEVVLTGVDLTSWGMDLPGVPRLGALVRRILAREPNLERLRVSSLDCAEADDEFWRALAEEKRFMPHLHLSFQSGCDLILKRMKRRHSRAEAIAFCRRAARVRPGLALGADLIVGFPTETEAMFQETLDFVDECGLSFLHVFPFSSRPGAAASRMPKVAPEHIRARAARLRAKGEAVLTKRLDAQIGKVLRVLVESNERGHAEDFSLVRSPPGLTRGEIVDLAITGRSGRELASNLPTTRIDSGDRAYGAAPAP